ncbi:uncharacterized protein LOC106878180 isoform X2 [Octopus bimaculoides]|uniref:uncharacterized protein LOC106878180 isoform X2 n=1 Tax=Octopus bimaculoides TaxID=37653 RepID=UPI0022E26273|nr:uncharacterized protein LOC106878180 isoform X2 [Octopus bimaculoides]
MEWKDSFFSSIERLTTTTRIQFESCLTMLRDKRYATRSIQSEMPGTSSDNVNCTSLDSGQAEATSQLPPSQFLTHNIIGNSLGNEQFKELSNANKSPSDVLFNDENNGRHNIQMRKFDCYNHTLENGEMVLLPQTNLHQSYQQQQQPQDNTVLLSGTPNNQELIKDYFHDSLPSSCCCSHVYSQKTSSFGNATQRRPEFCEAIMKSSCSGTISTSITSSSSISSSSSGGNISNSMSNHVLQMDSNSKSTNEFLSLAPNSISSLETCGGMYCDCPMSACQDIYCDGSICSCQNMNCDSAMSACQDVHFSSSMNICCRDMSCSSFAPPNLKCQGQMMLPKPNAYERNSYKSNQPLSNVNSSKAQANRFWDKRTSLQTQKVPNTFIYDLSYNNVNEQMDKCMAVKSEDNEKLIYSDKNQIWQYTTCHQTFPSIKHQNKNPNCCSFQNSPNSMLKVEKSKMWNCAHQPLSENFVYQEQLCKACNPTMESQEISGSMPAINYLHTNMKSRRPVNNMICKSSADLVPSQKYMHNGQLFFNSATTTSTSTLTTTSTITMTATTYTTATTTTTAASSNSFSPHCCSSCSVQPLNYKLFPPKTSECSTTEVVDSKVSLQYDQHSVISFMSSDSESDNMTWSASEGGKEEMNKSNSSGRSLPSPPVFKNVSEALHRLPESPKVPLVCMEDVIVIDSSPGSDSSSNDTPNNSNTLNSSVKPPTSQQQSFRAKTTTNPKSVKKLCFDGEKCESQFSKNSKESSKNHRSQEITKENPANSTSKTSASRSSQKNSIINNKPNPVFSRSNRIRSPSIRYKDDVLSFPLVFPSRSSQSASNRVSEIVQKSRVTNRRRQSDLEKVKEKSSVKPDETVTSKNLKRQTKYTPDTKSTSLPLDRRKMLRSSNKVEEKSPVKLEKDIKIDDKNPVQNKEVVLKQEQEDQVEFKQPENLLNKISPSLQNEDGSDKCHQAVESPPKIVVQSHKVNKPCSFEDRAKKLHTATASTCHTKTERKHNSHNTATTTSFTSNQIQPSTSSVTANFPSTVNTVIREPLPLSILSRPEKAISECKKNSAFVSSELDRYLAGEAESINSNVDLSFSKNKAILPKSGPFLPTKTTPFCDKTYAFEGNEKSNEKTLQKTTGIVYNTRSKCSSSSVAVHDSDKIIVDNHLHVDVFDMDNDANDKTGNVTNDNRDNVNKNTGNIINDNPDYVTNGNNDNVTNDNSNIVTNKITVNFTNDNVTNDNNFSVTNDYNDNVISDNIDNVTNNYTDNVCNDNIDIGNVNVKDTVNNSVNNNTVNKTYDNNNNNRENNHNNDNAERLSLPCNSSVKDRVDSSVNETKAGNSFSSVYSNHLIELTAVSKKISANNLPESSQSKSYSSGTSSLYEPDFDEVDGILFMSFPSEESLQAHIAVERKDNWESTTGHMSSISNILSFHRWKETHQEEKFPRPAFDKNMNLRGLHMRLKRYCKLLRSEWLKIKQKNLTRNNHRKAFKFSRFQMATRSKRWTRTNSALCAGRSITSRNKTAGKFQKLHWRTEARLLRGLKPEEVRQMGMKKKRRKKFIFTHRKGCKRQDASGNEDSDSGSSKNSMEEDAVSHTSVVKEVKEVKCGKNGYIHPMRSCCRKEKVVSVEEKMSKAVRSCKSHSDEEKPVIEKSAHLLYQSDEMHAIRKLGEFELNEPSIRKRTRSQVEYFKDQQTKNQRPNNSLPLTTFTQSMAQAATSALHDNFIRKNGSAATLAAFSDGKHDTDMFTQVDSVMDEKRRLEEASQLIPLGGCKGYKEKHPSQAPAVRLCNTSEEELDKETVRILLARQKLKAKNEKCNKPGCRYGCICHLCWISENNEELTKPCAISTKACDKEYCRLGCICDNNENTKLKVDCAKPCCELTCCCDSPTKNLPTESNKSSPPKNLDCNKTDTAKSPLTSPVSNECVDENSCSSVQDKDKLTSADDTPSNKEDTNSNKSKLPKKDKYASLPRRQMTHRTAKNLDAISRKAMMFYETSEMYHLKKKRNASGSEKENSKSSTPFKRTYSLRGSSSRHLSTENSERSSEHSGHTSDPYAYPGQSIENCVVEIDQVNGNKHCKQFGVVTRKMVPKEDTENYNVGNKELQQNAKETSIAKRLRMTSRKPVYHKSWSLRSKQVKLLDARTQSMRRSNQEMKEGAYITQSGWLLRSKERLAKTVKKEPVQELPVRRCHTRLSEAGNEKIKSEYKRTMKIRSRKASSGVNCTNKAVKMRMKTEIRESPQTYHKILPTLYKNNQSLNDAMSNKSQSSSPNTFQNSGIVNNSDLVSAVSEYDGNTIIPNSSSNVSNNHVQLVSIPFPTKHTNQNPADISEWNSDVVALPLSIPSNTSSVSDNCTMENSTCNLPNSVRNNIVVTAVNQNNTDVNDMVATNSQLLPQNLLTAESKHGSVLIPYDTSLSSSEAIVADPSTDSPDDKQCVTRTSIREDSHLAEAAMTASSQQYENLDNKFSTELHQLKIEKVDPNSESQSLIKYKHIDNLSYKNDSGNSSATSVPNGVYLDVHCYEDIVADDEGYHNACNSSSTKDKRNSKRFRNDIQRSRHMSRERERRLQILSKMTILQLVVYENDPENRNKILPKQVILDTAIELVHSLKIGEDYLVSVISSLYTKNDFLWEKLSKVKGELYEIGYVESEINKILDDAGLPFDMYKPPVISTAQTYEDMGSPLKFVPSNHPSTFECQIISDEDCEVDVVSETTTVPQKQILIAQSHQSTPNCNEPISNDDDVIILSPQWDTEEKISDVDTTSSTLMIDSVYSLAPENYENFSTSYNITDDTQIIQLD